MVMLTFDRRPLPANFEEPGLPKRADDDVELPSRRELSTVDAFQPTPNNVVSGTSRSVHGYGYYTYDGGNDYSSEEEGDDDRDEDWRGSDADLMDGEEKVDDEMDEVDEDEEDDEEDDEDDDEEEDEDEEDEGGDEDDDDPMDHISEDSDSDSDSDSDVVDEEVAELFRGDGGVEYFESEGDEAEEWESFGEIDEEEESEDDDDKLNEFRFHTAAEVESHRDGKDTATSVDTTCTICLEREICIQFKCCPHAACGPCTEGQWYTQTRADKAYSDHIKCHLCRAEVTIVGDLSRNQPVGEFAESFVHGIPVLTVFKWKTLMSWVAERRKDVAEALAHGALVREPEQIYADDFESFWD